MAARAARDLGDQDTALRELRAVADGYVTQGRTDATGQVYRDSCRPMRRYRRARAAVRSGRLEGERLHAARLPTPSSTAETPP